MAGRLEKLNEISRRVLDQNLRSTGSGDNVIAELHALGAQSRNLGREILDNEMNTVPAPGPGAFAIGHRSSGRTLWPAEQ